MDVFTNLHHYRDHCCVIVTSRLQRVIPTDGAGANRIGLTLLGIL